MSLQTILITYLIGGLTLPPILIAVLIYLIVFVIPNYIRDELEIDDDLSGISVGETEQLKLTELEDKETYGVNAIKSGWLTVTREYHTSVNNLNDKQLERKNAENKSAYTALYKLVKNSTQKDIPASPSSENDNSNSANISKNGRKKNRYFGMLRHGNLFLYKDEFQKDLRHVIVLSNNIVSIWPRSLPDGELFTKRSSIAVLKRIPKHRVGIPPKYSPASLGGNDLSESALEVLESGVIPSKHMAFFIYADSNYEKEDWYFSLIKATKRNEAATGSDLDKIDPSVYANPLHFKTADIISLIQTLHSSEGQLQTRWLNALIGRIFLSLQKTEFFENVVKNKLLKKLAKINKPGFLDDFQIKEIFTGNSAPFISFPKLIELNPDGSLKAGFHFNYKGKLSLQVSTKANINLGSHFKTREVSVLLAITLNKLEGPMIVSLKSPPSSRLWYTFEKMPDLDLTIEPIVSQRQLRYGMIIKVIENKFRDAVRDSLVSPAWDDISFFNTSKEFYRGGIWDITQRPTGHDTHHLDDNEKEYFMKEYSPEEEKVDEIEPTTLNTDRAVASDFNNNNNDAVSIRSRGIIRSKPSIGGSINTLSKKTDPLIGTSEEQFLSNGSFVSKGVSFSGSLSLCDTFDSMSTQSCRSKTMQIISEEATAGKKTITNSLKKIGKWYSEKNKPSNSLNKEEKEAYEPPEMIQSRKPISSLRNASSSSLLSSSSSSQNFLPTDKKEISRRASDARSIGSQDARSSLNRLAPHAHTFPPEYLYGLNETKEKTRDLPPSKIPEMRSPYVNLERVPSISEIDGGDYKVNFPKKVVFPNRKPIEVNEALIQGDDIDSDSEISEAEAETWQAPEILDTLATLHNTIEEETEISVPPSGPSKLPSRKSPAERKLPSTLVPLETSLPPPLPPREVLIETNISSIEYELTKDSSMPSKQPQGELEPHVVVAKTELQAKSQADVQLETETSAAVATSLAYSIRKD